MSRFAVVTGASSGIGEAIALELAGAGWIVIGTVRKPEDGARLAAALGKSFHPVRMDVTAADTIASAAGETAAICGASGLSALVNNAGIAVAGPLLLVPEEALRQQMEVNFFGVMAVTRAFFPLLRKGLAAGGTPRIVNMSSVSGRIASPFLGAYAPSKFALEAMSDSLRREVAPYGVEVTLIEPGRIATPIWGKSTDITPYAGSDYADALGRMKDYALRDPGMPAQRVSRAVRRALEARRAPTRIAVVDRPFLHWRIPRLLSDRQLDRIYARKLALDRPFPPPQERGIDDR